jgi:hypothetical protein
MDLAEQQKLSYAVVAATVSTLFALVKIANVAANNAVNVVITPSLASGLVTKYRIKMDMISRRDPRIVLITLAMETKNSSSYSHSPFSLSLELGFCIDQNNSNMPFSQLRTLIRYPILR